MSDTEETFPSYMSIVAGQQLWRYLLQSDNLKETGVVHLDRRPAMAAAFIRAAVETYPALAASVIAYQDYCFDTWPGHAQAVGLRREPGQRGKHYPPDMGISSMHRGDRRGQAVIAEVEALTGAIKDAFPVYGNPEHNIRLANALIRAVGRLPEKITIEAMQSQEEAPPATMSQLAALRARFSKGGQGRG